VHLEIEPGRYLVAEAGVLLAEVRATKHQGNQHFTLVDAGFSDLMRPAMYGAHHEMSIIPSTEATAARPVQPTVVAGPLCESGDVFTQEDGGVVLTRNLPAAQVGDLLVIHDTGAYGASMSSNYNTRPLIAEVMVDDGQARLIRRRQTVDELLALELGH
jgi:diaminopimelate decarboxylase